MTGVTFMRKFPSKISTLLLTSAIMIAGFTPSLSAMAAVPSPTIQESLQSQSGRSQRLPASVANAVRKDLARRLNIPAGRVRVMKAEAKTWPDGCLGLPKADEMCTEALVEGWQVMVSNNSQRWIYRTDQTGKNVRLASNPNQDVKLPNSVGDAVLRDLSQRLRVPVNTLQIVKAEKRQWPNGCLGIPNPLALCTQAIVPGWQVTVVNKQAEQQRWVYRTNNDGSVVALDEAASQVGDAGKIQPTQIPNQELPSPLGNNMVFRAIASGGITGRTYETVLLKDGRLMQAQLTGNGVTNQTELRRLSSQQVQAFQKLLQQEDFERFNRLNYPPMQGSADFITVTLSNSQATTRYADMIQDQLPNDLQAVIKAWNQITSR
jgi:hypothetical protein